MLLAWYRRSRQIRSAGVRFVAGGQGRIDMFHAWLARSNSRLSKESSVLSIVLKVQGYQTAVKGTNGFVCMVQRSWAVGVDDPEFWNTGVRSPICLNAPAARIYLPHIIAGQVRLAGKSKTQIAEAIRAALYKGELATPEIGAMCYMMSKNGYLRDRGRHWHPHVICRTVWTTPMWDGMP